MDEMFEAAEALSREGAPAVVFVAPLLYAEDAATRWRAAIALERIGTPAVEALVAVVSLGDPVICTPAIWALEHIADARAVGTLIWVLNEGVAHCRWMAATALLRIRGEDGRALVEAVFADDLESLVIIEELSRVF